MFTTGSVYFDVGNYMEAWEIETFTKEVFPFMQETMWRSGKLKCSQQEVFPLMREAMFLSGKLKFFDRKFFFIPEAIFHVGN